MKYDKGSFTVVPNIEHLRGLKPAPQTVFKWLCKYANNEGKCRPARMTLAADAGIDVRTVDRCIKKLIDLKLVSKVARKTEANRNLPNEYQIHIQGVATKTTLATKEAPYSDKNDTRVATKTTQELYPLNSIQRTKIAAASAADSFFKKNKNPKAETKKQSLADPTPFSLQEFVASMRASPLRHMQIIGEFADTNQTQHETKGQWKSFISRNVRDAIRLEPYRQEQLETAYGKLEKDLAGPGKKGFLGSWTLKTLEKYLDK